jgi:PAS domain S-box-containing protein
MTLPIDEDLDALHQVLNSLHEIVVAVDRGGVIRYINRVEPGYDRDQVLGTSVTMILSDDSDLVFQEALKATLATEAVQTFECETRSPDGSPAWYSAAMTPLRAGTAVVGAVIAATNITELKAAQAMVANLQALLPSCAWCGRIKTSDGSWESAEAYLERTTKVKITHGMCPECHRKQVELIESGSDASRPGDRS